MFFIASKVLWFFAAPINILLFAAFIGAVLSAGRHARLGRRMALVAIGLLLLVGLGPVGNWLIAPLEDRFPTAPAELVAPYGIIVLGGAVDPELGEARDQVILMDGAARLTEAVALARRFPQARLVFTGGSNALTSSDLTEAHDAGKLLTALGVDPARVQLEDRSRNTDENARFTRDLVHPEPTQVWLLVTSAYHMPRSMGLFRKAGFNVVAYPVDYRSYGGPRDWRPNHETTRGLRLFDVAIHEWIGLIAYRLSGKIDALFPAP
ncbi:YdcF family protein [Methylocapsa sp. S129]|uniref:YdcF family protein n=1 Tax=Methylocapsa sp. S129 TaxID=1641869 RepID=UPI00131C395F|nr:YdcF family protein [Methylocapsa sp. S129]